MPLLPAKYAWLLQESPSLLIALYYLFSNITKLPFINTLILILFIFHYINRAVIYPFLIKGGTEMPAHLFLSGLLFCTLNGYIQAAWHSRFAVYNELPEHGLIYVIGAVTYIVGMAINIKSDSILRSLRKDGKPNYKIPRGGLFEYISGANYLGECIEWTGYALFCRTFPAVAFAFFSFCNLAPRAYQHHRWYQQKFEDYPKNRKSFIPFIF